MNSDILNQKYCTLIKIHLTNKKKNNKITEAIAYQLNSLSEVEMKIISIINYIQITLNNEFNKNCDLSNIILGLIYLYNSKIIIYNLPSMLDKVNYNNKPCVHVLFGETVSQLTSVSLVTECFELIGSEQKSRLFRINKLFDLAVHVYIGILFLSHSYNVFDGVATQSRCTQKFLFELEWWDLLDVLFVQRTVVVVHVLEDVD